MNMAGTQLARWLLTKADASGAREALVGDLLEELARGQSFRWVCEQVIGLYGMALVAHAKRYVQLTPLLVALTLSIVLLGGLSIVPLEQVVQTWMSVYYVAGTLSLFAHVMSRTTASRAPLMTDDCNRPSHPRV
jgi:hypothetical protein